MADKVLEEFLSETVKEMDAALYDTTRHLMDNIPSANESAKVACDALEKVGVNLKVQCAAVNDSYNAKHGLPPQADHGEKPEMKR